MPIPAHLSSFWNDFAAAVGDADEARFYEAFFFGDSEALARELAALVLAGTKRATAGSVWSYETKGKPMPRPGDLSIVTDWAGQPLCVIETRSVQIVPFDAVTAEFAATEGEGDGSLASWRAEHGKYFTRECDAAGRRFSDSMPVVCECFELVYAPDVGVAVTRPIERGPMAAARSDPRP